MKLSVIIPSRGRSHQLIAVLQALHKLESGKNEVTYGVVCDVDDPETSGVAKMLQVHMRLAYSINERGPTLGGMVNKMAENMPADVYLSLADDALCLTQDWDEKIAEAVRENPKGVWWWKPADDKKPALFAIVSEAWRKAAGRIFTDYFPYWYDDIWLLTVWVLAIEGPMLTLDIDILDCPRETHRMRDLRFWHEFYIAMQPERVRQAKAIAKALDFPQSKLVGASVGLPNLSITEALSERLSITPKEFEETMEQIERNQGDRGVPTEEYVLAKASAELLLKQREFLTRALPSLNRMDKAMKAA
jgi:hypothetical protein